MSTDRSSDPMPDAFPGTPEDEWDGAVFGCEGRQIRVARDPAFLSSLAGMVGTQVTLYTTGGLGFGLNPVEAKLLAVQVKPWAQYKNALALHYLEKGKRKPRGVVLAALVTSVVAAGWGLPKPEHWLKPSDEEKVAGIAVSVSRHSSCSPEWRKDFERDVLSKLAPGSFVDLKGYDGHSGTIKAEVLS